MFIFPPIFSILSIAFLDAKEMDIFIGFSIFPTLSNFNLPLDLLSIFFKHFFSDNNSYLDHIYQLI